MAAYSAFTTEQAGQLKKTCGIPWAADLAISYPDRDRTFFRLVVGGHHSEVIRLFRDVEELVVGREAASVRGEAKQRRREARTRQLEIGHLMPQLGGGLTMDAQYARLRDEDLPRALGATEQILREGGSQRFGQVWPRVIESHHVTRKFLAQAVRDDVRFEILGATASERTLKDAHIAAVSSGPQHTPAG